MNDQHRAHRWRCHAGVSPDPERSDRRFRVLPDARVLASLGRAKEGALRLWRRPDTAALWTEAAALPMGRRLALCFDGTGARLGVLCETEVTAGHDGGVTISDAATGAPMRSLSVARLRRPYAQPRGVGAPDVFAVVGTLSPDGSRAAAVTIEGTVYAWKGRRDSQGVVRPRKQARGRPPPGSLRFAVDGGRLATAPIATACV
jgi:hypothetical protein